MTYMSSLPRGLGSSGLLAVAAIHANWARGSSWPAANRRQLAEAVFGGDELPSAGACGGVAVLLVLAAAFVSGQPRVVPRVQRLGTMGVVTVLSLRGLVGVLGVLLHDRTSEVFARWNHRLYSPLCLVLAALCSASLVADVRQPPVNQ